MGSQFHESMQLDDNTFYLLHDTETKVKYMYCTTLGGHLWLMSDFTFTLVKQLNFSGHSFARTHAVLLKAWAYVSLSYEVGGASCRFGLVCALKTKTLNLKLIKMEEEKLLSFQATIINKNRYLIKKQACPPSQTKQVEKA